jgi:hypothetical protein
MPLEAATVRYFAVLHMYTADMGLQANSVPDLQHLRPFLGTQLQYKLNRPVPLETTVHHLQHLCVHLKD